MITVVGAFTLQVLASLGALVALFGQSVSSVCRQLLFLRFRFREVVLQCYFVAVESFPVIVFSLTFVSLMMVIELSYHMKLVLRQDSLVPAFSTVLILRELGPVLTSLLLASRVGASISAELGTMRITEQLDALRLLAVDPVEYLVIPRWFASVFAAVSLAVVSVAVSIFAGAFIASIQLGLSRWQYFNTMFLFATMDDFKSCIVKSAVFGTIIPIVASHHGFRCRHGAEGVGNAATLAVVNSSVLIIIADFVLTYMLYAV